MKYEIMEQHIETRKNEAEELKKKFVRTAPAEQLKKYLRNLIKRTTDNRKVE